MHMLSLPDFRIPFASLILRRTNTSSTFALPRGIYVLSNGTETCARYTRRRRICHSRIGARSRLGGHSSTIARRARERKRRRAGDERVSKPSAFAYLRRQWAFHLRHGRRFSSSDNSLLSHNTSAVVWGLWNLNYDGRAILIESPGSSAKLQ